MIRLLVPRLIGPGLIALMAMGLLVWPNTLRAEQNCIDYDTSGVTGDCPATYICQAGGNCVPFELVSSSVAPGTNNLSVRVKSNAVEIHPFSLWSCLGRSTTCNIPIGQPSFWTSHGNSGDFNVNQTGLRSGRTHTVSLYGEFESDANSKEVQASTWPGFPAAPTVSNLQPTSATISWTTPFSGSTDVYYWPVAPFWKNEYSLPGTDTMTNVTATSTGKAWAVTYDGAILARSAANTWDIVTTIPATHLRAIDAFDDNLIWAVGDAGLIVRSTNSGQLWTSVPFGSFGLFLMAVTAPTASTAWAAGQNQTILAYDGVNWSQKYSGIVGQSYQGIATLDNKLIIAVGTNGSVNRSTNGGASWTPGTLPGGIGANVTAIHTLDGLTFWASGTGGKLWRTTDSGNSWQSIPSGSTEALQDVHMVTPSSVWLVTSTKVGQSADADAANPTFTFNSSAPITGSSRIVPVHGAEHIMLGNKNLGAYHQCAGSCNWKSGTVGTTHTVTFSSNGTGELLSNTDYYFSVETFGSGVGYGAFGKFRTLATDTTPPTVGFDNPNTSPHYTASPNYTTNGPAEDKDNNNNPGSLSFVSLTHNGTAVPVSTLPQLPGPASTRWETPLTLNPGVNNLVATARDSSNNQGSATAQVILDQVLPDVTITKPLNGETVNMSTVTTTGQASDNERLAVLEYQLNAGTRQPMPGFVPGPTHNWSASISGLTIGSNTLVVFAKDAAGNEKSTSVTFTYAEPTFTLDVVPATQTKNAGDTVTYTVNLAAVNGFDANVNLTLAGSPAGSTTSFSPNPIRVNGAASSTVAIITNSVTTCSCTLTVTGTGGGKTAADTATLILNPAPDFSLSPTPVQQSILGGDSATFQILAVANSTFDSTQHGNVAFTIAGVPAGVTASFAPGSVGLTPSGNKSTSLNLTTQNNAVTGNHTLTITGAAGSRSHTVTVVLNISAPPDFSLEILPTTQNVTAGKIVSYNGTAKALAGFDEQVVVTATTAPADAGITFSITPGQFVPAAGGTQFILNVTTLSSVPAGNYTVTVTGTSASLTRAVPVTLVVSADTTPPVISNIVAAPNWNWVRISWRTDEPADSELIIYDDLERTSVVHTLTDDALCTDSCHNFRDEPLQPSTTYYFSVASADADTNGPLPTPNRTTVTTDANGTPLQFTTLDEPDSTPPVIVSVDSPADGAQIAGGIDITGQATDNKKVTSVEMKVSAEVGVEPYILDRTFACAGADPTDCAFSSSWDTFTSPNGNYYLSIVAFDSNGNKSLPIIRTITIENDHDAPRIETGPDEDVTPTGENTCGPLGNKPCYQAVIRWTTDDKSTSEVEYCAGLTCSYNQRQRYDDTDQADPSPLYQSHQVTLTNLDPDELYHYRITSCNKSLLCAH